MTIKPLFDKVVVKSIEAEEKTASGILLPGTAQENPRWQKSWQSVPADLSTAKKSRCKSR